MKLSLIGKSEFCKPLRNKTNLKCSYRRVLSHMLPNYQFLFHLILFLKNISLLFKTQPAVSILITPDISQPKLFNNPVSITIEGAPTVLGKSRSNWPFTKWFSSSRLHTDPLHNLLRKSCQNIFKTCWKEI